MLGNSKEEIAQPFVSEVGQLEFAVFTQNEFVLTLVFEAEAGS